MAQERGFKIEEKASSVPNGNNYLLAIGIDAYEHVGKLNNPVKDAKAVLKLLHSKYTFSESRTLTCFDQEASWEGIDEMLRKCQEQVKPPDNLLIYFSGHGHFDEMTNTGYWVPVDARYNKLRDYYSYDRILKWVKGIQSQHTLLIVDSCYSGAILVRKLKSGVERLERDPSRWILASGRNEVVPDGDAGGNSPFAEELLGVLERHGESPIPIMELAARVTQSVIHNSEQTPIGSPLRNVGDKGGQFIFKPKNYQTQNESSTPEARGFRATGNSEAEAYLEAQDEHTIEAYRAYLEEFPNGKYKQRAERAIEKLQASKPKEVKPKAQQKPSTPQVRTKPSIPSGPIEMILIEGETFMMGSKNGGDNEKPVHKVSLDSYEMGKYPVTQKEWQAIMGKNPSHFKGENLPVEKVSWKDVQTFIKKINAKYPGMNYRLPTEAEWEFAARGGNQSKGFTYSGSNDPDEVGWHLQNSGDKHLPRLWDLEKIKLNNCRTHPTGQKKANELGIYDMSGNVWEWCQDWYDSSYYKHSPEHNPKGPKTGGSRVLRGGSWSNYPYELRVAYRNYYFPGSRYFYIGFRLSRSI